MDAELEAKFNRVFDAAQGAEPLELYGLGLALISLGLAKLAEGERLRLLAQVPAAAERSTERVVAGRKAPAPRIVLH
jgi:hypothetical protein